MAEKACGVILAWVPEFLYGLLFSLDTRSASPSLMTAEAGGGIGGEDGRFLGGVELNRCVWGRGCSLVRRSDLAFFVCLVRSGMVG